MFASCFSNVSNFEFKFRKETDANGKRLFSHLCTGTWWENIEVIQKIIPNNAFLSPIILYSDKTTINMGSESFHPIYMMVGNQSTTDLLCKKSKHLLAYLPIADNNGFSSINASQARRTFTPVFRNNFSPIKKKRRNWNKYYLW